MGNEIVVGPMSVSIIMQGDLNSMWLSGIQISERISGFILPAEIS
jgi:hypothetical protein